MSPEYVRELENTVDYCQKMCNTLLTEHYLPFDTENVLKNMYCTCWQVMENDEFGRSLNFEMDGEDNIYKVRRQETPYVEIDIGGYDDDRWNLTLTK